MPSELSTPPPQPWYRQFWPWFLVSILSAAVLGSMLMLYLAVSTQDGLVVDYYRKDGLAYREDRERDTRALQWGLNAVLEVNDKLFTLTLDGSPDQWPAALRLDLIHPTQAYKDSSLQLRHLGGNRFEGRHTEMLEGPRTLQLVPLDEHWRLYEDRTWFPLEGSVRLYSRMKGS